VVRQIAASAKARPTLAILAVVTLAGCGYMHRSRAGKAEVIAPRSWFLLVAPFTREFPHGDLHAPIPKWSQVRSFDSAAGCDAILEQAEDYLQRPVQCIASDDPRLKGLPAASDAQP
jgi:hypothetical protein